LLGAKHRNQHLTRVGRRDGKPAQLGIADVATPQQQCMTGARTQQLLRRPQQIATPRRTHEHDAAQLDARGRQRRRKREIRGRKPDDAPPCGRQACQGRQQELQLSAALGSGQDLGQRPARPAAARQPLIEGGEPGGQSRHRWRPCGSTATPDGVSPEDSFERCWKNGHAACSLLEYCIFIQYSETWQALPRPTARFLI